MRQPPVAYHPPRLVERHQDRWNRPSPATPRFPPSSSRVYRHPTSPASRATSRTADSKRRISSNASSRTLVPLSAASSSRAKSRGWCSSRSSVRTRDRHSSKVFESRLLDSHSSKHSTPKISPPVQSLTSSNTIPVASQANDGSPASSSTLPIEDRDQLPQDQVEAAILKLEEVDPEPQSRLRRILGIIGWYLLDQWFLLALALLVIVASQVQVPTPAGQQMKQTICSYLCVSVIFFITGCTLPTKVLLENYTRWKAHLVVQGQGFLMTSAITFGIVCALNQSTIFNPFAGSKSHPKDAAPCWLLVGMLFMGCVPTSISSNVILTQQAHGNMAFTVVQSTIGNFVAPFITPLLMNMYTGSHSPFPLGSAIPQKDNYSELYARVFKQLGLSVFLPMILGQVVQYNFREKTTLVLKEWKLSKLSSLSLLVILWQTVDQAFWVHKYYKNLPPSLVIQPSQVAVLCLICPALFIFWLAIAFCTFIFWLPRRDVIAACYCIPAKTPSLGVPLSTAMYVGLSAPQQSSIQIPLVIFQAMQILVGSLLTIGFRRWIASQERERKRIAATKATTRAVTTRAASTRAATTRNASYYLGPAATANDVEKSASVVEPDIADADREFVARRMSRWRTHMMSELEELLSQYHIS